MMTKMEVTGSILLVSIKNLPLIVSRVDWCARLIPQFRAQPVQIGGPTVGVGAGVIIEKMMIKMEKYKHQS